MLRKLSLLANIGYDSKTYSSTTLQNMKTSPPSSSTTDRSMAKPCLLLTKLPPELRVRIYDFLVLHPRRLVPKVAVSSAKSDKNMADSYTRIRGAREDDSIPPEIVDIKIFLLNKQIYDEAADHFYGHNRFYIPYEYLCRCHWLARKSVTLNEKRMKHLRITGVEFEDPQFGQQCKMCHSDGYGLVKYLNSLPGLKSVVIYFTDAEGFGGCGRSLLHRLHRLNKTASLEATEVGWIQTKNTTALIDFRLSFLIEAWPAVLARVKGLCTLAEYADEFDERCEDREWGLIDDDPHECHLYSALGDILGSASILGKSTLELKPFLEKIMSSGEVHMDRLDLQERAEFSIVLAEYLCDVMDDDDDDGAVEMADRNDLVDLSAHVIRYLTPEDSDA